MNLLYPGDGAIAHDRLSIFAPLGGPIVQLENELVRCSVLPWFGAAIVELTDKQSGIDVLCPGLGAIHNIISQPPIMAAGQEYFNRQAQGQMDSVDNHFLRNNDPRMPLFSDKKTSTTRGGGFGSGSK